MGLGDGVWGRDGGGGGDEGGGRHFGCGRVGWRVGEVR